MRHQIKFDASNWTYKASIDLSLTLGPQGCFTSAEFMHRIGEKKVMKEDSVLRDFQQFSKSTINSQFGLSMYNSPYPACVCQAVEASVKKMANLI